MGVGESSQERRASVTLSGVPETMLWTLWNRAAEMRRKDRLIEDPLAVELVDRLDYDFLGHFGKPSVFHPIRARVCDDLIREHTLQDDRNRVVVSLGEGLETQAWRVGDLDIHWITVDVPEAINLRKKLLPVRANSKTLGLSALDFSWMDSVPKDARPFISANGLLMYFEEVQVRNLLTRIAERFPGGAVFFDVIPPYFSEKTMEGFAVTKTYTAPPMPWGVTLGDVPKFIASIPGLRLASVQSYAKPFPMRTLLYAILSYIPTIEARYAGGLVHLRVGTPDSR